MNKKTLIKAVAVWVYAYILTMLLELIISGELSNTSKISISTGVAIVAYIQMFYKDIKNKQKG
ncbi:hypothetical protein M3592_26300 [Priestia aryabhattai]|uniref:hypothetical protein n=1 Tax=Priestia aryabhattai TaxID=412384 RepID=UPI0020425F3E|nr:hypothetical protein [Priestia aryabhattai]MCM2978955.1 hypothetical protein [Priestia aryabhattai]